MSDLVTRLRGAADAAARTLSGNSMMPPEMSGLGDAEAEDLIFLCRDASDRIEALEAEVEQLKAELAAAWEWKPAPDAETLEQRLRDAGVE